MLAQFFSIVCGPQKVTSRSQLLWMSECLLFTQLCILCQYSTRCILLVTFLYLVEIFILDHSFRSIGPCCQEECSNVAGQFASWWLGSQERAFQCLIGCLPFSLILYSSSEIVPPTCCVGLLTSVNLQTYTIRCTQEVYLTSVFSDSKLTQKINHHSTQGINGMWIM